VAITDMNLLVAALIRTPTVVGKDAGTAEAAGVGHTPWYQSGLVGAGSAPTGGLNGVTFTASVAGQIPVPAAVSGKTSAIARWSMTQAGNIGGLWLVDRLWGNVPVVTTTTSQSVTSPTWPARDTSASTSGEGVYLALECSSATGNGSPITNTTVSYTNSAGASGKTATLASYPATAVAGTWAPLSLAAGDTGVRSVQSITLGTSYVSGAVHLVAFRLVADLPTPTANVAAVASFPGNGLPSVWDSSVLQLVYWPTGTALGAVSGSLSYAQG
jgi:hypothetical protein